MILGSWEQLLVAASSSFFVVPICPVGRFSLSALKRLLSQSKSNFPATTQNWEQGEDFHYELCICILYVGSK